MSDKVCCMFSDPVPGHAVDNNDLELIAKDEWSRRESRIYRCRRCGAYVLYKYEENIFYSGWDNADIDIAYYPIKEPVIKDGEYPDEITLIKGSRYIGTSYREEDWARDRDWSYGTLKA